MMGTSTEDRLLGQVVNCSAYGAEIDAGKPSPDVESAYARVVKLVDTRDLKSLGGDTVMPVRFRPRAPHCVHPSPQPQPRLSRNKQAGWWAFTKRSC